MKTLFITLIAVVSLLTGCQTPGKLIASSNTTVDHAMQAWAVWVVDGHSTPDQERRVRELKLKYDHAEDLALEAYVKFSQTGDIQVWANAKEFLLAQQNSLISLINLFSKGGAK